MGRIAREDAGAAVGGRAYTCRIRDILASETLDVADRAVVEARLADERNSHRGISDWLDQYGFFAAPQTVQKHRAGRCQCARDEAAA